MSKAVMIVLHIMAVVMITTTRALATTPVLGEGNSTTEVTRHMDPECAVAIVTSVNDVFSTNYHSFKLPDRRYMRIIRLYDGVVQSIGSVRWNYSGMRQTVRDERISIDVNATFTTLDVRYRCMLTAFGADIRMQAKDLLMQILIVFDMRSGGIDVRSARIRTGKYVIRAILSGSPQEGDLPEDTRKQLADFIQNLVSRSHLRLTTRDKCLI